ncbi:AMP-dependent synthetase [Sphingomonas sp. Leaf67]|uniref:class I adenylate-forming enzyme family protein n=1 Tax=Sphingomonas sp. Leaf67 TaxID=1736230 RepID=UPI0006FC4845|nr:long-chain fatty acid--CoA ligase [Sphingomonas sp. Leaf67]KQN82999.1 AMP-dependent synthetase [Sphingomonas sp. Leaf67]
MENTDIVQTAPSAHPLDWFVERLASGGDRIAFIHRDKRMRYDEVVERIAYHGRHLEQVGIARGEIVCVLADYSPDVFCFMLALAKIGAIQVPLTTESVVERSTALSVCGCDWQATFDAAGREVTIERYALPADNALLDQFREGGHPGLILFSSGSTGTPKAILHDMVTVAEKFRVPRAATVAIAFLMIDHFGGINTIIAITSSLGTVVTVGDRSVGTICRAIADARVELLPATPSFLTMMLSSGVWRDHDLSSLTRITYGTEVMPQSTLDRMRQVFPNVEFQQTYGLSEVGVLRSKSRPDGSLWVKLGGSGFETKVVDDVLWVRSQYAMVGYLNAPSKFDAEGWFNTQDRVEQDGEWVRIHGRVTDLINVGGQKVYPTEIEDVILTIPNVADVAVFGEDHALLGKMIVARVLTVEPEAIGDLKKRIRAECSQRLANYKVPSKVILADGPLYSGRQKKLRG